MLLYEKIDISEGIDFKKSEKSKECMICYYQFFKNKNFNFEKLALNGYRDISMMGYELKSITKFKIKVVAGVFYGI